MQQGYYFARYFLRNLVTVRFEYVFLFNSPDARITFWHDLEKPQSKVLERSFFKLYFSSPYFLRKFHRSANLKFAAGSDLGILPFCRIATVGLSSYSLVHFPSNHYILPHSINSQVDGAVSISLFLYASEFTAHQFFLGWSSFVFSLCMSRPINLFLLTDNFMANIFKLRRWSPLTNL